MFKKTTNVKTQDEVIKLKFKLTYKTHLLIFAIAIIFSIAFYDFINSVLFNFYLNTFDILPEKMNSFFQISLIFLVMIFITIVHELIHGIVHITFGGKVKYSFKIIYAATQEVSGNPLTVTQFLIVLVSPLVFISMLSLLLPAWIGPLVFLMNLIGSFGDIYMGIRILGFCNRDRIIDRDYGFDVVKI